MGVPCFAATITLPRAASDNDRSMTSGASPRRGNTAAMGLVPKIGVRPPAGGMADGELPNASPTIPDLATGIRKYAATPK